MSLYYDAVPYSAKCQQLEAQVRLYLVTIRELEDKLVAAKAETERLVDQATKYGAAACCKREAV